MLNIGSLITRVNAWHSAFGILQQRLITPIKMMNRNRTLWSAPCYLFRLSGHLSSNYNQRSHTADKRMKAHSKQVYLNFVLKLWRLSNKYYACTSHTMFILVLQAYAHEFKMDVESKGHGHAAWQLTRPIGRDCALPSWLPADNSKTGASGTYKLTKLQQRSTVLLNARYYLLRRSLCYLDRTNATSDVQIEYSGRTAITVQVITA